MTAEQKIKHLRNRLQAMEKEAHQDHTSANEYVKKNQNMSNHMAEQKAKARLDAIQEVIHFLEVLDQPIEDK